MEKLEHHKMWHKTFKELTAHYKEMYDCAKGILEENKPKIDDLIQERNDYVRLHEAWVWELRFERMKSDFLENILYEIRSMTTDPIVRWIVDNAIERKNLDQMIHNRMIFDPELTWKIEWFSCACDWEWHIGWNVCLCDDE